MDKLFQSLETFYEKNETDDHKEKSIYDELAEKEEALFLAAKFGEKLLEEKEQLESQIEALKKDYQNRIEILEQEKYELKIIIDTLKNEYDNKVYELNEDIQLINKQLMHHQSLSALKLNENQRFIELIQELNEKNQCLNEELKANCENLSCLEEKYHKLELDYDVLHFKFEENEHILNNYQNEISLKNKKTIELEYCLMQISSDFDKKCVSIDELRKKLVEFENENYELNQLVYQHERTIDELKAKLNHTYYYDRTTFYDEDYENYNNMFESQESAHSNWKDECEKSQSTNDDDLTQQSMEDSSHQIEERIK